MRPFGEHFGRDFAKIVVSFSRLSACGAQVAHRSPADVVAQTKGGAAVITLACLNPPAPWPGVLNQGSDQAVPPKAAKSRLLL